MITIIQKWVATCEECGEKKEFESSGSAHMPHDVYVWRSDHEQRCPAALQRVLSERLLGLTEAIRSLKAEGSDKP